jgi:hypothetical protein
VRKTESCLFMLRLYNERAHIKVDVLRVDYIICCMNEERAVDVSLSNSEKGDPHGARVSGHRHQDLIPQAEQTKDQERHRVLQGGY